MNIRDITVYVCIVAYFAWVKVMNSSLSSSLQCHVFIQEGGERSIVMAPAATSLLNQKTVTDNFGKHPFSIPYNT